jgi:hypothetical protein
MSKNFEAANRRDLVLVAEDVEIDRVLPIVVESMVATPTTSRIGEIAPNHRCDEANLVTCLSLIAPEITTSTIMVAAVKDAKRLLLAISEDTGEFLLRILLLRFTLLLLRRTILRVDQHPSFPDRVPDCPDMIRRWIELCRQLLPHTALRHLSSMEALVLRLPR